MRTNHNFGNISNTVFMETVPKISKPRILKQNDGITTKPKARDTCLVSRGRRYSVDIVSSKPIINHVRSSKNSISNRRFSLGTNKTDSDVTGTSEDKQSEVRSILKSGFNTTRSISVHSSGTESTVSEDTKGDVKCSYRLPKTKEPSKLRKCVSFKEEDLTESISRRRYSSPALDMSTNYLIST